MATPTVVSASSTTAASGTSLTITAPASLVLGNILLAVIATTNSSTLATPVGWTLLNAAAAGEASYWRTVTSSEPASYTWTWTAASVACGLIVQIAGNSVMPLDATAGQANASSASIVAATVTPKWNADLLVNIYASNTAAAITVPGGQSNIGGTTGNSRAIICGYETLASGAATGTRTATGTAAVNYGFSFAVREPAIVGTLLPAGIFSIRDNLHTEYPNAAPYGAGAGVVLMFNVGMYYGQYKIAGNTLQRGSLDPLIRQVILFTANMTQARGAMTPAADGAFTFTNLAPGTYTVLGIDQNGVQNSVVAALVDAVPM